MSDVASYPNAQIPGSPLDIAPVAGRIGTKIRGVQLSGDLIPAIVHDIGTAPVRHKAIFFRDQQYLDAAEHEAFASLPGDPVPPSAVPVDGRTSRTVRRDEKTAELSEA